MALFSGHSLAFCCRMALLMAIRTVAPRTGWPGVAHHAIIHANPSLRVGSHVSESTVGVNLGNTDRDDDDSDKAASMGKSSF